MKEKDHHDDGAVDGGEGQVAENAQEKAAATNGGAGSKPLYDSCKHSNYPFVYMDSISFRRASHFVPSNSSTPSPSKTPPPPALPASNTESQNPTLLVDYKRTTGRKVSEVNCFSHF